MLPVIFVIYLNLPPFPTKAKLLRGLSCSFTVPHPLLVAEKKELEVTHFSKTEFFHFKLTLKTQLA